MATPDAAMDADAAGPSAPAADPLSCELTFLVLHALRSGPCVEAANALEREASAHGLLPRRYAPTAPLGPHGELPTVAQSYAELASSHSHVTPQHLRALLEQLLRLDAARRPLGCAPATLLGAGDACLVPSRRLPALPRWTRWPHARTPMPQLQLLRETGGGWGGGGALRRGLPPVRAMAPVSLLPDALNRLGVLRGHCDAVYNAIFDATGAHLITGSDDLLVKIWSAATGMLLHTCRGHEREITYLAASVDGKLVASASIDCTIRTWRLADGAPVSVLLGHTQVVTELAFHPAQERAHILLSVSMDDSARVWDALSSDSPPLVVDLAEGSAEAEPGAAQTAASHITCTFSPDGSLFAAGTHDFSAVIWRLDITTSAEGSAAGTVGAQLVTRLQGHRNEISFVQFNAGGDALLSGSKDGTVRVWRAPSGRADRRRGGRGGRSPADEAWTQAHVLSPPAPPPAPHARRQRAPPAVNMVRWSGDGRCILVAMEDASICLWDSGSGTLRARLARHTKEAFVVEPHPLDARLALSAGYDGRVVLWDVAAAAVAAEWDLRGALPEDGMRLLDARWSPDGSGFAVSDEGGRVHVFGARDPAALRHAQPDQFFAADYGPLLRDARGFVADAATGRAPHLARAQPLCRYDAALGRLEPYPEPYQSAFQQRAPRALGVLPEEQEEAFARDPRVKPQPHAPQQQQQQQQQAAAQGAPAEVGPARRQRLFRAGGAAAAADAEAIAVALLTSSSSSSSEDDDDEDASGASDDDESDALRPARRGARRMDRSYEGDNAEDDGEEDDEAATGEEATGDDDGGGGSDGDGARRRSSRRVRAREAAERERRAGLRARRRDAAASDALAAAPPVYATRNAGARRARRMRDSSGGEEEEEEEEERGRRSKRLRSGAVIGGGSQRERLYTFSSEDEEEDDSPRRAQRRLRDRQRRDRDRALKQARHEEREALRAARREARAAALAAGGDGAGPSRPVPSRRAPAASGFRPYDCWAWLQQTSWRVGEYIPQLGDCVVYIPQGHLEYLSGRGDARAARPWLTIPCFRAAEPCVVTGLDYVIVRDKGNATVARLTLTLTDAFGALRGERFELELPDMTREGGSPDFLVPLSRFVAAAARGWAVGDRAVAWWPDGGDPDGGRFWVGTVWAVSQEETAWRGSPWNRLAVDYEANDTDDEPYKQSPWELFDPAPNAGGGAFASSKWVPRDEARPSLEPQLAAALCDALGALCALPANASLRQPPGEDALASPDAHEYYAASVALPLGLDTLHARVASGYYRQPEAVRHDVLTLRGNALRVHGEGSPQAAAAVDAADALLALLPPPAPLPTLRLDGTWPVLLTGPRAPVTRSRRSAPSAAAVAIAAAAEHGTRSAVAAANASQVAMAAAAENGRFSVRLRVRP